MAQSPHITFYFLHLLGVGHVYRAKRLIEGFSKAGIKTDVIYGGMPIPNVNLDAQSIHYLPPIQSKDSTYSTNLDGSGNVLTREYMEVRKTRLLEIFDTLRPDAILVEAFPFGRRVVKDELTALLKFAKQREYPPLVISSVRDILQERKKPGRYEETRDLIHEYFDHVLVHSDPDIIGLGDSYPLTCEIEDKLAYTGFVLPPDHSGKIPTTTFDIIVSAGGGAFGKELMDVAAQAANIRPEQNWCLATGPNLSQTQRQALANATGNHVKVCAALPNLADHLKNAKLSISQCGYNTAMDVLAAHRDSDCRAVLVPYDTTGQTEQLRRSELLDRAGFAINLPQSKLTIDSLNVAIEEALALPKVDHSVKFDGVKASTELIHHWLQSR